MWFKSQKVGPGVSVGRHTLKWVVVLDHHESRLVKARWRANLLAAVAMNGLICITLVRMRGEKYPQ